MSAEHSSALEAGKSVGAFRRSLRRGLEKLHLNRIVQHVYADTNSTFTFIPSGREALTTAEHMVAGAQNYSISQFYSYDMDAIGHEYADNLRATHQARPAVSQNLIVDGSIAMWNHNGAIHRKNVRQMKDEAYREINHMVDNGDISGWVTNWFHILKSFRGSSNPIHRDHKKIVTVDGQEALLTSANIGEHHTHWGDIGVKIDGPVTRVLEEDQLHTISTAKRWKRVHGTESLTEYGQEYGREVFKDPKEALFDLLGAFIRNPSRRGRKVIVHEPQGETQIVSDSVPFFREATRAAFGMIKEAKKGDTLHVGTPYPGLFVLAGHLMAASLFRHADVTLHIPHNNNYALYNAKKAPFPFKPFVALGNAAWKGVLKASGVKVSEYNGNHDSHGMNHAKFVSLEKADGNQKIWLGSSNLSIGPVTGFNREIAAIISNKEFSTAFNRYVGWLTDNSL